VFCGGLCGWGARGAAGAGARPRAAALYRVAAPRRAMAEVAVRHVRENFTLERMCAETLAVYREVLAGGPAATAPAL
jgi:glycosyltransferase involved in cell wall biosynthesis